MTTPIQNSVAHLVDDRAKLAHALTERSTSIGRDASNEIVIRDPSASRFHAEIRQTDDGFVLHSIGASGTVVNGAPVAEPARLSEGDVIEIAFVRLRFTTRDPGNGIRPAPPHSSTNDEISRKPTLGSEVVVVDENNQAGRGLRRVQLVVVLVVVLGAALWWMARQS